METLLNIPDYNPDIGMTYQWEDEFDIKVTIEEDTTLIVANKQGLISLANHFLNLAQDNVPTGTHLHLDVFNSLEDGSNELIIQKK